MVSSLVEIIFSLTALIVLLFNITNSISFYLECTCALDFTDDIAWNQYYGIFVSLSIYHYSFNLYNAKQLLCARNYGLQ